LDLAEAALVPDALNDSFALEALSFDVVGVDRRS
jgi:hypothetical protein